MRAEETPAAAIEGLIQNFKLGSDKLALKRIHESLDTLSDARRIRIDDLQQTLSQLSRQLASVRSQYHVAAVEAGVSPAGLHTSPNAEDKDDESGPQSLSEVSERHTKVMMQLDRDKFRIAKQASELEIEGERLEMELGTLKAQLAELDMLDNEDVSNDADENERQQRSAEEDDEVVLRLKVYRSLGIDVEPADPITGQYTKAVIRNPNRGDVHVINMDPKFSKHFYANYFWQSLG